MLDKIRTNVSIGYHVNDFVQEEPENRSEIPIFRVTDWTLLEVSSVSIPSDFEVGAFRSSNSKPSQYRKIAMEVKGVRFYSRISNHLLFPLI